MESGCVYNKIRSKTYTIKYGDPIYILISIPKLEESKLRNGRRGQREARATWANGFSRLDVGQGDMGDPRSIGREDWCAASRTAWVFEAWLRSLDDEGERRARREGRGQGGGARGEEERQGTWEEDDVVEV